MNFDVNLKPKVKDNDTVEGADKNDEVTEGEENDKARYVLKRESEMINKSKT